MVRSPRLQAFELSARDRRHTRPLRPSSAFGQGCLLARRLVEAGITFVEVDMPGWDTHQNNFTTTRRLSGQADAGFAALIHDLRDRHRLDRTLVIWMGEFGRTPRINANTGRDHYPRAFSIALAGAGIRGGRVIGATSDGGNDVTQRPVARRRPVLHVLPRTRHRPAQGKRHADRPAHPHRRWRRTGARVVCVIRIVARCCTCRYCSCWRGCS